MAQVRRKYASNSSLASFGVYFARGVHRRSGQLHRAGRPGEGEFELRCCRSTAWVPRLGFRV